MVHIFQLSTLLQAKLKLISNVFEYYYHTVIILYHVFDCDQYFKFYCGFTVE